MAEYIYTEHPGINNSAEQAYLDYLKSNLSLKINATLSSAYGSFTHPL
jgi:hypothetical protein